MRFEFYVAPLPEAGFAALGARPGWQARTLEVEPGVKLRGLVHAPQNEAAPWVLFFAGNSPTLLAEAQTFLDTLRGTRDFGVAAPRDAWRCQPHINQRSRLDPTRSRVPQRSGFRWQPGCSQCSA